MKKRYAALIFCAIGLLLGSVTSEAKKKPSVTAESAIVMDVQSGAILYEKNIDKREYPASITKLLTTLVALDNAELTDTVEFSQDSISFLEYGDAHIGMTPGEQISMEDALYAVLLASANEVSYAVAESVGKKMGGGYDTFIQAMNDESEKLGCTGSHWTNANGLHDEQHYTTAHDMARIGAAVYQKEAFHFLRFLIFFKDFTDNGKGKAHTLQGLDPLRFHQLIFTVIAVSRHGIDRSRCQQAMFIIMAKHTNTDS